MSKLFGTDGIRGIANVELTTNLALKVGKACAKVLKDEDKKLHILIGSDTRISSSMIVSSISAGLAANGCDVTNVGVVPTPCVSYLVKNSIFDAGIMVSASHNSFEFNGIKIFDKNGLKLPDLIEEEIEKETYKDETPLIKYEEIGIIKDDFTLKEKYISYLISTVSKINDLKVVFDLANGSSSVTAPEIFNKVLKNPVFLSSKPNGININDNCGSTHLDNLINYVKENKFDLGIAFDGDADRVLCVDENGNVVDGDLILYVCGKYLKERGQLNGDTIVTTIMSNLGLYKACDKIGMKYEKTKVGDKYVYENMVQNNFMLGGEQSGHVIFAKHATTGDGILTSLMVMEAIIEKKQTLGTLADEVKIFPQLLKNVRVKDKKTALDNAAVQAAVEKTAEELGTDGRILVRESGTEPVIRVMVEAASDEICEKYVDSVVKVIESEGLCE